MISSHPTEEYGLVSLLLPDSPRKEIVSTLLDQSCKNIRKTRADNWSSEEEDDDVFEATGEEATSPQTGDFGFGFSPQMCSANMQTLSVQLEFLSSCFLFEGPAIVTEEYLAGLAVISPMMRSQYSGSRVKAIVQILQHQLDQQDLLKEFMVCTGAVIRNKHTPPIRLYVWL